MNARLRVSLLRPKPDPKVGAWSPLSAPVDGLENFVIARAQSLMSPTPKGGACPPLTLDQARDVLRWAKEPSPL